jgi:hypothetical protein
VRKGKGFAWVKQTDHEQEEQEKEEVMLSWCSNWQNPKEAATISVGVPGTPLLGFMSSSVSLVLNSLPGLSIPSRQQEGFPRCLLILPFPNSRARGEWNFCSSKTSGSVEAQLAQITRSSERSWWGIHRL